MKLGISACLLPYSLLFFSACFAILMLQLDGSFAQLNTTMPAHTDRTIILDFIPFQGKQYDDLQIRKVGLVGSPSYMVNGTTNNTNSGFSSYTSYAAEYLSLVMGKVEKTGNPKKGESQISFTFDIRAANNDYKLTFVNGRLSSEGWVENTFFKKINANSSVLVNLPQLLSLRGDKFSSIERVILTFEDNMIINYLEFKIDFYPSAFPR